MHCKGDGDLSKAGLLFLVLKKKELKCKSDLQKKSAKLPQFVKTQLLVLV